jgi:hypothetical protein
LEKIAVDLWAVFENVIRGEAESTFPNRRFVLSLSLSPSSLPKLMNVAL